MQPQPEIKPVEQPQAQQDKNTQPQQIAQPVQEKKEDELPESAKDINWKAFKEARAEDRKRAEAESKRANEKQAEAEALKAALEAVLNKQQPQQQQQQSYSENEETEEQRIDKRVAQAIARREAEYEKKRLDQEATEYPKRLNEEFKDFSVVCSSDNLDYLDYHYPEVSKALSHMPQGFEKWSTIYKAVKKLIPNTSSNKDAAKADRNMNKPQSMSAPGMTHSNENVSSFKLDEKRKAENYARMQRTINKMEPQSNQRLI